MQPINSKIFKKKSHSQLCTLKTLPLKYTLETIERQMMIVGTNYKILQQKVCHMAGIQMRYIETT